MVSWWWGPFTTSQEHVFRIRDPACECLRHRGYQRIRSSDVCCTSRGLEESRIRACIVHALCGKSGMNTPDSSGKCSEYVISPLANPLVNFAFGLFRELSRGSLLYGATPVAMAELTRARGLYSCIFSPYKSPFGRILVPARFYSHDLVCASWAPVPSASGRYEALPDKRSTSLCTSTRFWRCVSSTIDVHVDLGTPSYISGKRRILVFIILLARTSQDQTSPCH